MIIVFEVWRGLTFRLHCVYFICFLLFLCMVWALPWQSGASLSLCTYLSVWSAQMTGINKKSVFRELKEKLVRHIHSFIKTIMRLSIGALTGNQH